MRLQLSYHFSSVACSTRMRPRPHSYQRPIAPSTATGIRPPRPPASQDWVRREAQSENLEIDAMLVDQVWESYPENTCPRCFAISDGGIFLSRGVLPEIVSFIQN